jgi:hypothetical protein
MYILLVRLESIRHYRHGKYRQAVEVPVIVQNKGPNQGTGVMEFVNTKDTIGIRIGVVTTATGVGTRGTSANLMKAAVCAVC